VPGGGRSLLKETDVIHVLVGGMAGKKTAKVPSAAYEQEPPSLQTELGKLQEWAVHTDISQARGSSWKATTSAGPA
jgi:hypothetical protein